MPDHARIYRENAKTYERLISKQKPLLSEVEAILPVAGLHIVDAGAGTGRLTASLAPSAASIVALDASEAMLAVNAAKLADLRIPDWHCIVADNRKLPLPDGSADLLTSGWSVCYLASSNHSHWQQALGEVMTEFQRLLRPGGTVLLFETMGTGVTAPEPPAFLRSYYRELEETYGFCHKVIRFDYSFDSVEEAEELTRLFFGEELAEKVVQEQWQTVPEFAGIWWKQA